MSQEDTSNDILISATVNEEVTPDVPFEKNEDSPVDHAAKKQKLDTEEASLDLDLVDLAALFKKPLFPLFEENSIKGVVFLDPSNMSLTVGEETYQLAIVNNRIMTSTPESSESVKKFITFIK